MQCSCCLSSKINPQRVQWNSIQSWMEAWCTAFRVNEFQKIIINSIFFFKYLKAKKQGFHLTPIRTIIVHNSWENTVQTFRVVLFKVCERKFWTGTIKSWYQHVNLLLAEWVGLNLTFFFFFFLSFFFFFFMWVTMILEFLASYRHLAILLLQLTFVLNKSKIFQGFHLSTLYSNIIYYYIYYYHNLNNNDNYLNPTTYITNKNQYFLFYLFSDNTTRRPWHWITNRAQQDQPYSNESLEIQTPQG